MKGRGARTIDADEFQTVTPDAVGKTKFLLVDAVGVTDSPLVEAKPLQPVSQRRASLRQLLAPRPPVTASIPMRQRRCLPGSPR